MKVKHLLNKEENLHSFNEALQQIRKEQKLLRRNLKRILRDQENQRRRIIVIDFSITYNDPTITNIIRRFSAQPYYSR